MAEVEDVAVVQPLDLDRLELARDARHEADEQQAAVGRRRPRARRRAAGRRRASRAGSSGGGSSAGRRRSSASRGFARRMCEPSGQPRPCGSTVAVAEVVQRAARRGRAASPSWARPDHLGRERVRIAARPVRRAPRASCAGTARRPGGACATPCRCRCGRRARPARAAAGCSGSFARVLVGIAEHELAGRERAPSAARQRHAAAVRARAVRDALDRRLGEAVGEAEVLAHRALGIAEQAARPRGARARRRRRAPPAARRPRRRAPRSLRALIVSSTRRRCRAGPSSQRAGALAPVSPSASARSQHAVAELAGEARQHVLGAARARAGRRR